MLFFLYTSNIKNITRKEKNMPKTKFQDFVYTIIMVVIMVYAMVCYNVSTNIGGMSNKIFLIAIKKLPIMVPIAFILEFFIVSVKDLV